MLNDEAIDSREVKTGETFCTVLQIIKSSIKSLPTEEALWHCARLADRGSIREIEIQAIWYDIGKKLSEGGLSKREVLQVLFRALVGAYREPIFSEVAHNYIKDTADVELARELCEEGLSNSDAVSYARHGLTVLAQANQLEEHFDPLLDVLGLSTGDLRIILEALPDNRREKAWLSMISTPNNAGGARARLRRIVRLLDLVPTVTVWEKISMLVAWLKADMGGNAEEIMESNTLLAQVESKTPVPEEFRGEDGLTEGLRKVMEYWLNHLKDARRSTAINEIALKAHSRNLKIQIPELNTIATWQAATPERKKVIALEIASLAKIFKFIEIQEGGLSLAIYKHVPSKQFFSLVPGGTYERGLSLAEEGFLRKYADDAERKGTPLHQEDLEIFLHLNSMRPVTRVTIDPLLVSQSPHVTGNQLDIVNWLDSSPFRLLSESEWEWLARGGQENELTWKGNIIPTEKWMKQIYKDRAKSANAFGLWNFGYSPELCADVWHDSYYDASKDGTPRWGDGPRVVRGGAGQLSPWQGCSEWQLLCTAVRQPISTNFMVVRPALGLQQI